MIHQQLGAAIASASTPAQLDEFARALWRAYAAGQIADHQAQSLGEQIEARRNAFRRPGQGPAVLRVAVTREEARTASSEAPRPAPGLRRNGPSQLVLRIPRPPSYDRSRSLERRRQLAASGPMPPALAASFTTAELAVLRIVGDEVREHGRCERTLAEIAARAGVSRTTTQNALRRAARLGLVAIEERRRPGNRDLPNLIRIISREWLAWLEHGRGRSRRRDQGSGFKNLSTTACKESSSRISGGSSVSSEPNRQPARPKQVLTG